MITKTTRLKYLTAGIVATCALAGLHVSSVRANCSTPSAPFPHTIGASDTDTCVAPDGAVASGSAAVRNVSGERYVRAACDSGDCVQSGFRRVVTKAFTSGGSVNCQAVATSNGTSALNFGCTSSAATWRMFLETIVG